MAKSVRNYTKKATNAAEGILTKPIGKIRVYEFAFYSIIMGIVANYMSILVSFIIKKGRSAGIALPDVKIPKASPDMY